MRPEATTPTETIKITSPRPIRYGYPAPNRNTNSRIHTPTTCTVTALPGAPG